MDYVIKIRHRSIKSRVDLLVPTLYIGMIVQLALGDAVEDYPLDVEHYLSDWVNYGEAHPCKEKDITDDPDAINLCSSIDTPIYMPRLRRVLVEPGDRCRAILHRLYYIVPDFFEYLFVAMSQKVACDATYIYDWMYFALIEACYPECIDRSMALTLASTGDYRTVTLDGKLYEQDRLVKVDYADALMVHAIVCLVGHYDRPTFLRLLARCHDLLGLPIMELIDALDDETELIPKVVRILDGLSGEVLHSDNFMYEPTNMAFFHRAMKVANDDQRLAVGDRVQILCGVLKIYNDAVPKRYKLLEQFMDQMNGYSTEDLARLAALLTFVKLWAEEMEEE